MVIWNIRRAAVLAAAVATVAGTVANAQAQKPGAGKPTGGATGQSAPNPMDAVKASLKKQYGFSDAQADIVAKKAMIIAQSYQPQLRAVQAKYGANPTPQMQQKRMAEIIPIVSEIGKKTSAVLLSVATKGQRPRIMQKIKMEQERLNRMANGGGAKP